MGTTANRAIRYPASTDTANGIEQYWQHVAEDADAALGPNTGWLSTPGIVPLTPAGATSGTGLPTITAQTLYQNGPCVAVNLTLTLAATISVGSDGNVTNTPVAQLPSAYIPSASPAGMSQPLSSGSTGAVAAFTVTNAGIIQIVATTPGATLAAGTVLQIAGIYLL